MSTSGAGVGAMLVLSVFKHLLAGILRVVKQLLIYELDAQWCKSMEGRCGDYSLAL